MALSTQRIHSVHSAFGSSSLFSPSSSIKISRDRWDAIPNKTCPRVALAVASLDAPCAPSRATGVGLSDRPCGRPRRITISMGSPMPALIPSRQRPATASIASLAPLSVSSPLAALPDPTRALDDPFADPADEHPLTPLPTPSFPPGIGYSYSSSHGSRFLPRPTRGRQLATTLLNRGSGRPMGTYLRRRLSGEPLSYVKSSLSQLVATA
ncbi:uncharacterized protein BXZ73DRAFT_81397 [Epithele typhae]|uniref:uncharacterized protein n=1 Tax=Epithele typhae TaxID=378194 RepID=UPI002007D8CF|nr:uncharacterized protein BXZ73DRAFT_81397 [Epithele typhae]KAH9915287.1 hypothetical protein BXZ73DRAFT_81397 [Epithele typhae]